MADSSVGGAGVGEQPVGGNDQGVVGNPALIVSCFDSYSLLNELILRLGNRQDLKDRAKVWLDQAYKMVTSRYRFRELEVVSDELTTTVAGQREYTFPTKAYVVRSIKDLTHSRRLTVKDWNDLENVTETSGSPSKWARFGNVLILDPTPVGAFSLRVRVKARPNTLQYPPDHSESLFVPCEWTEAILRLAQGTGHGALPGEAGKAAAAMGAYAQWIQSATEIEVEESMDLEQTLYPRNE